MLLQIALNTKTLIAYKAVVWVFSTVLHARQGTSFAGSVYYIYHIGGFSPPYEQILCGVSGYNHMRI